MATLFRRTFTTFTTLRVHATMNTTDLPQIFHPPINRAMKELDRSFFNKTIPISAATIFDAKQTSRVRNILQNSNEMLALQGIRPIVDDSTHPGTKCLLLKPSVKADQPHLWSPQLTTLVSENTIAIHPHNLQLTYDNYSMSSILDAILPEPDDEHKETPAGFAQAGHIAHMNIRDRYHPYRKLIGQVLLDKNPIVRTVINKIEDVGSESVYRTFPYEVLAGEDDLDVTVAEQGCEFHFNFAEVYWNSRLSTEHERIVAKIQPGQAVCDAMAGVGPFAIPAGKKKAFVRANDLNPQCFEGLEWAIHRNKVQHFVRASCMDAREFIRAATAEIAVRPISFEDVPNMRIPRGASPVVMEQVALKRLRGTVRREEPRVFDHYIMNLPASAVEFLDAFQGLYYRRESEFAPYAARKLPFVHVYTFQAKQETMEQEIRQVCEKISGFIGAEIRPGDEDVEVHQARLVSPKKWYYCATFRLPESVAFAAPPLGRRRSRDGSTSPYCG